LKKEERKLSFLLIKFFSKLQVGPAPKNKIFGLKTWFFKLNRKIPEKIVVLLRNQKDILRSGKAIFLFFQKFNNNFYIQNPLEVK
jgi:hypothetical protein